MRRVLIAGTNSGCGKTTVTCALLSALRRRGLNVSAFKCGPDYIDPMFHREVIGVQSHNLDSFFCDPDTLRHLLHTRSAGCDAAVIEGVMGYYDGTQGSACSVAQLTDTPAVLVIDCKGMSDSIGAVMQGFLRYRADNRIAGFIFNRLPQKLVPLAKRLCEELGTAYFGAFPPNACTIESRHLGLVTAAEIDGLQEKLAELGKLAEQHLCIDKLLALDAPPVPEGCAPVLPHFPKPPVIAVARDRAFCFHYAENLELLAELGCTLRYFSPMHDAALPAADGLLLCGGYPELYARTLSEQTAMRAQIRDAIRGGMPVIAECGGFLYLHKFLQTADGERFPMVGVFPGEGFPTGRLGRFGYLTMTAAEDSLLCEQGGKIRAHEFHYWDSPCCGEGFAAEKSDGRSWRCGHTSPTMYAGFPHLYFYSNPDIAVRFAQACIAYGGTHEPDQSDYKS